MYVFRHLSLPSAHAVITNTLTPMAMFAGLAVIFWLGIESNTVNIIQWYCDESLVSS